MHVGEEEINKSKIDKRTNNRARFYHNMESQQLLFQADGKDE